jgi:DNA-binding response OmpR family regulator
MKKILLIDDDEFLSENISEILQLENYHVVYAKNGEIGIDTAIKEIPDLIICDINMPVKNGHEVIDELSRNEKTKDIPFIFLSAHGEINDKLNAISSGATDFIQKPFNELLLLATVSSRIKKNETTKEAFQELSATHIKSLETMLFITSHSVRKPVASCLGMIDLIEHYDDEHICREDLKKILTSLKPSFIEMDVFIKQLSNYIYETRLKAMYRK